MAVTAVAVLAAANPQSAQALPITIVDTTPRNTLNTQNLTLPLIIPQGSGSGTLSWLQDITDDPAWVAGSVITSATLDILFQDANGNETLNILAESTSIGTVVNIANNAGTVPFNVTLNSTIDSLLQSDGILNVDINWTANGNQAFQLVSSTLTVNARTPEQPPTSVPEPTTLAAFGASLLGLAVLRRRRK